MRWIGVVVCAAACTGPQDTGAFRGEDMLDYFPFSEVLDCQWQFLNEDTLFPYRMLGEIENDVVVDGVRQFTVAYRKDCFNEDASCADGDFVRSMTWSVQGNQGVNLHDATVGQTTLAFEPTIRFTEHYMKSGDVVETTSNGDTYTSTLVGFGDCPVRIEEWDQCAEMRLESSGGPDPVTATYWLINDFTVVAMKWDDEPTRWELSTHRTLEE